MSQKIPNVENLIVETMMDPSLINIHQWNRVSFPRLKALTIKEESNMIISLLHCFDIPIHFLNISVRNEYRDQHDSYLRGIETSQLATSISNIFNLDNDTNLDETKKFRYLNIKPFDYDVDLTGHYYIRLKAWSFDYFQGSRIAIGINPSTKGFKFSRRYTEDNPNLQIYIRSPNVFNHMTEFCNILKFDSIRILRFDLSRMCEMVSKNEMFPETSAAFHGSERK
ncbi:hypothetical protein ABKN59_011920 [Abortiporus biennis]